MNKNELRPNGYDSELSVRIQMTLNRSVVYTILWRGHHNIVIHNKLYFINMAYSQIGYMPREDRDRWTQL